LLSFSILLAFLRDPEEACGRPLDVVGLLLLISGVGAFQYLLSEGERYEWFSDPNLVICAVVAFFGIVGLIVWELRGAKTPVVDIAIFQFRSLSAGVFLALITGAALYGTQYVLPQYVQNSLGFTATLSGLLVFVKALPIAVMTLVVVPFTTRMDARWMIAFGFLLTALSSLWQGLVTTPISGFSTFIGSLVLGGAAVAFIFVPISVAVLGSVPQERGSSASAWINLAIQLGGSISIALLGAFVDRREAFHQALLAATAGHAALTIPSANDLSQLAGLVTGQSLVLAYADTSYVVAFVCVIAMPMVFLMKRPRMGGIVEFGG
jgi:DHA2 family multidrug resistance protein